MKNQSCNNCSGFSESIFCSLHDPQLQALEAAKVPHKFKAGQTIFHSGDQAVGLYCVTQGTVKLEASDNAGKNHLIQLMPQGAVLGYRALFTDEPFIASAVAVDDVQVCFIPKSMILDLVEKNPAFALKFITKLSHDFRQIEMRLQHATSHSAAERVAEALLFLRENFKDQTWTRKEIAEWAGTTPETTIRTLAQFETEGLIAQEGRTIHIRDRKGLLERARITV